MKFQINIQNHFLNLCFPFIFSTFLDLIYELRQNHLLNHILSVLIFVPKKPSQSKRFLPFKHKNLNFQLNNSNKQFFCRFVEVYSTYVLLNFLFYA